MGDNAWTPLKIGEGSPRAFSNLVKRKERTVHWVVVDALGSCKVLVYRKRGVVKYLRELKLGVYA